MAASGRPCAQVGGGVGAVACVAGGAGGGGCAAGCCAAAGQAATTAVMVPASSRARRLDADWVIVSSLVRARLCRVVDHVVATRSAWRRADARHRESATFYPFCAIASLRGVSRNARPCARDYRGNEIWPLPENRGLARVRQPAADRAGSASAARACSLEGILERDAHLAAAAEIGGLAVDRFLLGLLAPERDDGR